MRANGFTLIEVIFASSLFLSFMTIFIPISSKIVMEQQLLNNERNITQILHEELQAYLWSEETDLPNEHFFSFNNQTYQMIITLENDFVKGCVNWDATENKEEKICLYGLPKE